MNTTLKNLVPAILFFLMMFAIAVLAPKASAQTTNNEPCVAFRYDGFENQNDAPATISKARISETEEMIKEYNFSIPLNGNIGLPSMEEIKDDIIKKAIESMRIHIPEDFFGDNSNNDSIQNTIAHLIREDWGGSHS